MGFLISIVRDAAVYRADIDALFSGKGTGTFSAFGRIDDVDSFGLGDSGVGALRFTGTATYAFVGNLESHFLFLTSRLIGTYHYNQKIPYGK